MFGSIVFDFGVIALNFGSGEGGGQGAHARPSLGSSARPCAARCRTKAGATGRGGHGSVRLGSEPKKPNRTEPNRKEPFEFGSF